MQIQLVETENHLFLNLCEEDGEVIMETPIFTEDDVKKVLKSYVFFVQSVVLYDSIEHDESNALSKDELKKALQTYSQIDGENITGSDG